MDHMLHLKYLRALWILFIQKWLPLVSEGKKKTNQKKKTFSKSIQEFSEKEILVHSDLYVSGCGPL